MEANIRYPEHFAPVAEEEMVYLTGGSILNDVVDGVTDVVDGAVGVTNSALGALGTIATVVGVCVLGVSYIWGIRICPSRFPTSPATWWRRARSSSCGPSASPC